MQAVLVLHPADILNHHLQPVPVLGGAAGEWPPCLVPGTFRPPALSLAIATRKTGMTRMGKGILLWFLGIPLPIHLPS
ncbi:MAG: hypothetical protein KGN34_14560 [Sphingomonadales bacterium]|nr:hypothetical protein [Sphingomonadales bacterium]